MNSLAPSLPTIPQYDAETTSVLGCNSFEFSKILLI